MSKLALLVALLAGSGLSAQAPTPPVPPSRDIALAQAVDSASLVGWLRSLPSLQGRERAVVSISFAASGAVDSIKVTTPERVAPGQAGPLVDAVRATVRTLSPAPLPGSITVALQTGRHAVVASPRQGKPELLERENLSRRLDAVSRNYPELFTQGPRTTELKFMLNTGGATEQIEVTRSSGSEVADAEAVKIVAAMRFRPGSIEGQPIPVWIILPITMGLRPTSR